MAQQLSRSNKIKLFVITSLVVGLVIVVNLPNLLKATPPATTLLTQDDSCQLKSSPCVAADAKHAVQLEIKADQISSAQPMLFEVTLNDVAADQVMLDLTGKHMYMGINQVQLNNIQGTNRWQGEVSLAVCATGEMTWVTSVLAAKGQEITQANFEFKAK